VARARGRLLSAPLISLSGHPPAAERGAPASRTHTALFSVRPAALLASTQPALPQPKRLAAGCGCGACRQRGRGVLLHARRAHGSHADRPAREQCAARAGAPLSGRSCSESGTARTALAACLPPLSAPALPPCRRPAASPAPGLEITCGPPRARVTAAPRRRSGSVSRLVVSSSNLCNFPIIGRLRYSAPSTSTSPRPHTAARHHARPQQLLLRQPAHRRHPLCAVPLHCLE